MERGGSRALAHPCVFPAVPHPSSPPPPCPPPVQVVRSTEGVVTLKSALESEKKMNKNLQEQIEQLKLQVML